MTPIDFKPTEQTQTAHIHIVDGIIHVTYLKDAEITVEVKKEHHRFYKEITVFGPMPMLLKMEDGVSITRDARVYSRKIEDKQPFTATAVLVNNLAYKILANFYANFYRPKKPFKVFDNEEKAIQWLQQFKNETKHPESE
ncbi:MAG: hypothetical protein K1X56_00180 [Flavobacteriales bacterium]|nr:hypothetical protein [Flavobacteriales bacterium]